MIIAIVVHKANIHDSVGAKFVFLEAFKKLSTLKIIWADQGYQGPLILYVFEKFKCFLEIVERISDEFKPLRKRWIVERTFAWMNNYRVLSKDYEICPTSSKNMVYISMLHRMLRQIA